MAREGLQVRFRNKVQVALYECELKGQISDGNWENSAPFNHWEDPCAAVAVVGKPGEKLGPVNFWPRRNYGFGSPFLLECVGDRMLFYARAVQVFPELELDTDSHWNWDKKYTEQQVEAECAVKGIVYGMKQLKADLNDMSRIFAGKPSKEEEKVAKAKVKAEVDKANKEFYAQQRADRYNHQMMRLARMEEELELERAKLRNLVKEMTEKDARSA